MNMEEYTENIDEYSVKLNCFFSLGKCHRKQGFQE